MRIYARKTTIETISTHDADEFIKQHHDQGLPTIGKGRFDAALTYDGEVVGVITCCNPRTTAKKKQYQQELVRLTFKTGIRVVGGASKLIKHYIVTVKPRNFFTYQTLGGELTSVYEHAGMTFVKKTKTKTVLVKNGYTYKEALSADKYTYLNAQLVNLGPDQLLGTKIGEVYEDGKRITNPELFIRYCGYHKESVPGDAVYEYENPHYTHYVYKITNTDKNDRHYYIGRHSIYSQQPLELSDLVSDTYMGSGGRKFKTWLKDTKNGGFELVKEILSIQYRYSDNLTVEEQTIGNAFKDDPNCLNSIKGGTQSFVNSGIKPQHVDVCEIHGETMFNGCRCMACHPISDYRYDTCSIHGETIHNGDACCSCTAQKGLTQMMCEEHGLTAHRNNVCLACQINCEITSKVCPTHGMTNHKGDSCMKCASQKTKGFCPKHGTATFNGETCMTCVNRNTVRNALCPVHGLTKFQGEKCCKCSQMVTIEWCDECGGETKWRYGKCTGKKAPAKRFKPKKETTRQYCKTCKKETRHVGGQCMSCVEKSLYNQQTCPIHGLTKFRANTCCACRAERMCAKRKENKI